MDNIHLPERPQNGSIGLDTNRRISSRSLPIPDSSGHMPPTPQIVTVVVHKDVNGYGMKVSGDNPVFVQSVRDGGAAERAGLQAGDTIIKVNGEDVIKSTHTEVVALIRSTTHVKLTVKQHPRILRPHVGSPIPAHHQNSRNLMASHHHSSSTQITAPQPVDHEKLRQFENERVHLIRMMLEKAQTHVEALRSELASLPTNADSSKLVADLQIAERTVGKLQTELQTCLSFTAHDGLSASSHSHTLPKSLTVPSSPHSSIPQSKSATQIFDTPPPLPNRNKINDLNSVNLSRSSTRLRSTEHLDNHKNYHPRNLYHKSPSQSPVDCNLVENQLYHSKFKDLDNSDIMLVNYHRKNPLSPKSSPGKHNKVSKRVKGSNSNLSYEGASANSNINEPDIPPPLPPRIPLLLDPFLNSESGGVPSTPSPSGIIEPDAVNSINKQMSYPLVATCAALVNNPCSSKTPHIVNTHHRTNSSPDPLILKPPQDMMQRLINSESMNDLSDMKPIRCDSWNTENIGGHITPPGTPPPPYPSSYRERSPNMHRRSTGASSQRSSGDHSDIHEDPPPAFTDHPPENMPLLPDIPIALPSTPIVAANSNVTQKHIISMEDEMSDQEVEPIEDGPFKSLSRLWEHLAHLAVFMNYILTNCDPSSILFYLITDLYKEGNAKDMKKWAYEIHSSFLVPGSPLRLKNVDENVAREIDDVLQKEADKEEILRKIFLKARAKAKEELNELLAEFRQKRNAGLGTLYGPTDAMLDESILEKSVENKIIEEVLQKKLTPYLEDLDHEPVDPRKYTSAVALSTVFTRIFGLRLGHSDLERLPSFVSRDKSLRTKIIGRRGKMNLRGHHFIAYQYYTVNYCNHCQLLIWGIGPQAYRCSNCHSNIHRHCVKSFEENCPGPVVKKEKGDPLSKIMGRIRPDSRDAKRKPSSHNFIQVEREKRQNEEKEIAETECSSDRPQSTTSITRSGSDRRSDASEDTPEPESCDKETIHENFAARLPRPKSTQTSINRSESYKEQSQKRRQIKERRKISDPNLSKSNDVEPDIGLLSYNTNSGSSSNSSLSSGPSLDSPSNSLEAVSITNNARSRVLGESDPETEAVPDPSDWTVNIPEDLISRLSSSEKKRQDVFNELLQTERSHVRQLRVLEKGFQKPLDTSNLLTPDQLSLLFPNLDEMLILHSGFSEALKALRKEKPLVGEVGETILNMFDGASGEAFENAAETFCARQQIALEWLRERRRKDAKLHNFLTECEADKMCRRLQLKDLIPTGMLRLTKYPLLFENLAKYTSQCLSDTNSANPLSPPELDRLHRAVERSKEILNSVNTAVKKAEDQARLLDIQRRLDRSGFDKVDHPLAVNDQREFKNIDITKRRLIYEGALYWRISSNKRINLHVLLLDDVILLLQKQDDKFSLKFHHTSTLGGTDRSIILSPIIRVSTVLVRTNATDNNSLYLITTAHDGPQMYDLVASSPSEIKQWYKYITEANETFTKHEGRHSRASTESDNMEIINEESISRDHMQTIDENGSTNSSQDSNDDNISMKSAEDEPQESSKSETPQPEEQQVSEKNTPEVPTTPTSSNSNLRVQSSLLLSTEQNSLIEPSEVTVSVKSVLTAEPVLTPLERLRRTDLVIKSAIAEKQLLVADILSVPRDEFVHIAEVAAEPTNDKEATELILAAINQANQLAEAINDTLNINEEAAIALTSLPITGCSWPASKHHRIPGVPPLRLQTISSTLNLQLTQLLKVIKERDEEREKLRNELHKSREQIHILHELHRLRPIPESNTNETGQDNNYELDDNSTNLNINSPDIKQSKEDQQQTKTEENTVAEVGKASRTSCPDCNSMYIGQTGRSFQIKRNDHLRFFRNKKSMESALADHRVEQSQSFPPSMEILHVAPKGYRLEAMEIYKNKNGPSILLNEQTDMVSSSLFNIL